VLVGTDKCKDYAGCVAVLGLYELSVAESLARVKQRQN